MSPPPSQGITGFPPPPPGASERVPPLMTRDEIEAQIAEGHKIFILHGQVIKVDSWLKYHPGGDKALLHMVGKDASDEVDAFHPLEARERMLKYRIGRVEGLWKGFVPPIQGGAFRTRDQIEAASDVNRPNSESSSQTSGTASPVFDVEDEGLRRRAASSDSSTGSPTEVMDGMSYLDTVTHEYTTLDLEKYPSPDVATQAKIIEKYRALHQRVFDAGLYQCNYWAYGVECMRYVSLFALMWVCIYFKWYFLGAFFLGAMWQQLVFTAHDAGHMGITHSYEIDTAIGILIADFIGGLSLSWWKYNHNVHHIVTNAPEHDPDIEEMPFFAVSHRLLGSLRSTYYDRIMAYDAFAKFLISVQAWTYYPILSLARLNLYYLSWDYLLAGRGPKGGSAARYWWIEIFGQVFFWTWFAYGIMYKILPDNWTRFGFFMISHIAASPVHLQIVLSHFAMSTMDLGPEESFAQKTLRTTMDVDCPEWLDFFHGGLQFQVIHHLFPRVPRHNLRKTQKLVQEFCNDVGIPYALYGFANSNQQVIGRLAEVSRQAAILAKCQKSIIENGNWTGVHH